MPTSVLIFQGCLTYLLFHFRDDLCSGVAVTLRRSRFGVMDIYVGRVISNEKIGASLSYSLEAAIGLVRRCFVKAVVCEMSKISMWFSIIWSTMWCGFVEFFCAHMCEE